jgi:hypothetical protein
MPTAEDHREISRRNERFYESIGGPEAAWSDWAVTILFYAALHDLTALAIERNLPLPEKHKDMKDVLRVRGWEALATGYATLLSRSWRARYKGSRYKKEAVEESHVLLQQLRVEIAELPDEGDE